MSLNQWLLPQTRRTTKVTEQNQVHETNPPVPNAHIKFAPESYIYSQYHLTTFKSLFHYIPCCLQKFTMRFIPFLIAGATFTLFNVYAYAKPVMESSSSLDSLGPPIGHMAPYCEGYSDDSCHTQCITEGFKNSVCSVAYVQLPSLYIRPDADM